MKKHRYLVACAAMAVAGMMAANIARVQAADADASGDQEKTLIGVLQSDAPPAEKAITCKHLAVHGSAAAVPALAELLPNAELSSWARIALEAIPDPAADAALRAAAGKLEGRLLIGVLNSIGERRDTQAVDALAAQLKNADEDVASAAAIALGRVANTAATNVLEQSLTQVKPELRSAVAQGCILCAEKQLADGQSESAAALYDKVRQADVPKTRIVEATRGAIIAHGSAGIPLLVEQLQSDDKTMLAIGLTTARELTGAAVTEALVGELQRTTPQRQALLLTALADRGDTSALPAVLQVANRGSQDAQIAAIGVLQRLGDASCIETLLEIAASAEADVELAAKTALEELPGDDVDAELAERLKKAKGKDKLRQVLIELAGLRRIEAVEALLEAADDSDPQIRTAALTALGSVVELDDVPVLINRVVAPRQAEDTMAAQMALRNACIRMPDREACAAKLAAAMSPAPLNAKLSILEILSQMGGPKALATVGMAAKDPSDELQDAASRLLGEWMTVDAGPVLLDLAKTSDDGKYEIRALRGYIRLARQFTMPESQRADMCRLALATAKRDAEKQLVLQVLERYPNIDTLQLAVETAKIPALKDDASTVALAIAQRVSGNAGDVEKLLAQVGQEPVKVEIIKAEYGAGEKFVDVTQTLRKHARDFPLIVLPSSTYNSNFGGDPVSGVPKQLKVQYRINGREGEATFAENATLMLPIPK